MHTPAYFIYIIDHCYTCYMERSYISLAFIHFFYKYNNILSVTKLY